MTQHSSPPARFLHHQGEITTHSALGSPWLPSLPSSLSKRNENSTRASSTVSTWLPNIRYPEYKSELLNRSSHLQTSGWLFHNMSFCVESQLPYPKRSQTSIGRLKHHAVPGTLASEPTVEGQGRSWHFGGQGLDWRTVLLSLLSHFPVAGERQQNPRCQEGLAEHAKQAEPGETQTPVGALGLSFPEIQVLITIPKITSKSQRAPKWSGDLI